ncbi:hypothetical protein MH138_05160 [Bacillus safensis]|nr:MULTISPECIES: hypothetical protein [Bacillus]MCY7585495.1 hypothetical protein [Bacillus safensis]MCY7586930.1 hypothetical protein [Bacillus safensis]
MNNAKALIKKNDLIKIENSTYLDEHIKNKDMNVVMRLNINVISAIDLYKAFCIEKKGNGESSRIAFFLLDNFPDGIFIEVDDGLFNCHIFELKFTGSRDLKHLTKQLFSGYVHCKTLLSVLDIEPTKINFFFNVVCAQENNKQTEYNLKANARKVISGEPIVKENKVLKDWLSNKLVYSEENYSKTLNIRKIVLDKKDDSMYSSDINF